MSRGARFVTAALTARPTVVAALLAAITLTGWTLHEVVPRYHVERHHEARGRVDHPSFLIGDCPYYRATLISLLEDHDLDVRNNLIAEQYAISSNVSLGRSGALYPKHPILLAIAALPFYVVAGDPGLLAFNLAQLCALVLVMWLGARRHAPDWLACGLLLWFAFGTMLRGAAYNFAPDVLSTLLVTGAVVALLAGRGLTGGLLLGLSVWAKWTNAVLLPVAAATLAVRRDWRGLARFGAAAALPVLALLGLDWHMFGSPLVTPYDRVMVVQNAHLVAEPSHRTFFTLPFWRGLWTQLTDRNMGLVAAAPPVLLALPGLVVIARRDWTEALLIGGMCAAQLATFAKYEQWHVGSYGPRFLLSVVALSAIPAAAALSAVVTRLWRRQADAVA